MISSVAWVVMMAGTPAGGFDGVSVPDVADEAGSPEIGSAPGSISAAAEVEAAVYDEPVVSPQPRSPGRADVSGRGKFIGAGFGVLAGSAGLWAATARLRMLPEIRAEQTYERCIAQDPDGGFGCALGSGIGQGIDSAMFWSLSYLTATPAVGLMGVSGYLFGRARRQPLRRPRAVKGLGIAVAIAGAATWLLPRAVFLGTDGDAALEAFHPTFYAGFALAGVGTGFIAYAEGARDRPSRREQASVRLRIGPSGITASGRF